MSGYSVKQLLKWTIEDHLVDSYSVDERGEYNIRMCGESIHLPPEEARKLLIALLRGNRSTPDREKGAD